MYDQMKHLDTLDKRVLPQDQTHVKTLPNPQLKTFIERNRPKLQNALRRTRKRIKQQNHNMLEYVQLIPRRKTKSKPKPKPSRQSTLVATITTAITKYFRHSYDKHHKCNLKPP